MAVEILQMVSVNARIAYATPLLPERLPEYPFPFGTQRVPMTSRPRRRRRRRPWRTRAIGLQCGCRDGGLL